MVQVVTRFGWNPQRIRKRPPFDEIRSLGSANMPERTEPIRERCVPSGKWLSTVVAGDAAAIKVTGGSWTGIAQDARSAPPYFAMIILRVDTSSPDSRRSR